MVRKYFGTDGIRGKANEGAMTAETALRVGMAAGRVFRRGDHRHRVVIGKDTRLSGYMLEPALTAGFTSMGMDVFLFGPLPTTYDILWSPLAEKLSALHWYLVCDQAVLAHSRMTHNSGRALFSHKASLGSQICHVP